MALLTRGSFWSMDGCTTRSTCRDSSVPEARAGAEGTQLHPQLPAEHWLHLLSLTFPEVLGDTEKHIAKQFAFISGIKIPQVMEQESSAISNVLFCSNEES